jgi:hypothetical protein
MMVGCGLPELILLVSIFTSIFWIWMLIDAAINERDTTDKVIWVLIVLFLHFLGAAVYYIVRYRPRRRR